MKIRLKRYTLTFVLMTLFNVAFMRAEMRVREFRMLERDIDANVTAPVRDHNSGKNCAIVKIVTTQKGFYFDIGNMGSPEKVDYKEGMGEIWLYMPVGCKKVKISHPKFGQLDTDTKDGYYWFPQGGLHEARCYRMVLNTGGASSASDDGQQKLTTGWLVLDSEPTGADVYIGVGEATPEYVGTTPFQKKYPYGNYNYILRKNMYHDLVGIIEMNQSKVQQTYSLKPAFGKVKVTSVPSGARVEIEGVDGTMTTPCTSRNLKSGTYTVRLTRDKYSPVVRQVTITDGTTSELNVPLSTNFASVTINTLTGAEVSINGKAVGNGSVTQELGEGVYDIQATKAHHRTASRQIEVLANKPQTITLNPTPIYGLLDVMTTPIGASVTIGGKNYGETPLSVEQMLEGEYEVVLTKAGCATVTQHIAVAEGKATEVSATLPQGKLVKISCSKAGAHIYVDGKDKGVSPFDGSLSFGTHSVYAESDGKKTSEKTIEVTNGAGETPTVVLSFTENRTFTVNGVTFTMVEVEGGTFAMGSEGNALDERPVHQVTLSSYMIGQTEVTQALWKAVMGENPSFWNGGNNTPVENVSWDACQKFMKKLNRMTGENFRLPTEAEWEFAARGGNKSKHYQYSGSDDLDEVAWYRGNGENRPHEVAAKKANELGIYDMSGNVEEWCSDLKGSYENNSQINPSGANSGMDRVCRGGNWGSSAVNCRSSYRNGNASIYRFVFLGLRLALTK